MLSIHQSNNQCVLLGKPHCHISILSKVIAKRPGEGNDTLHESRSIMEVMHWPPATGNTNPSNATVQRAVFCPSASSVHAKHLRIDEEA